MNRLQVIAGAWRSISARIAAYFDGPGAGARPSVVTFLMVITSGLLRLNGEEFASALFWHGSFAVFAALTAFDVVRVEWVGHAMLAAGVPIAMILIPGAITDTTSLHTFYVVFMCCSGYAFAGEVWAAMEDEPVLTAFLTSAFVGAMPVGSMAFVELYMSSNIALNAVGGLLAALITRYALIDRYIAMRHA